MERKVLNQFEDFVGRELRVHIRAAPPGNVVDLCHVHPGNMNCRGSDLGVFQKILNRFRTRLVLQPCEDRKAVEYIYLACDLACVLWPFSGASGHSYLSAPYRALEACGGLFRIQPPGLPSAS